MSRLLCCRKSRDPTDMVVTFSANASSSEMYAALHTEGTVLQEYIAHKAHHTSCPRVHEYSSSAPNTNTTCSVSMMKAYDRRLRDPVTHNGCHLLRRRSPFLAEMYIRSSLSMCTLDKTTDRKSQWHHRVVTVLQHGFMQVSRDTAPPKPGLKIHHSNWDVCPTPKGRS